MKLNLGKKNYWYFTNKLAEVKWVVEFKYCHIYNILKSKFKLLKHNICWANSKYLICWFFNIKIIGSLSSIYEDCFKFLMKYTSDNN